MFYNGYRQDVALIALFTLLGAFLKEVLGRNESNLLVYNTLLAYIMEMLVVGAMVTGYGRNLSAMTAGVILFLVCVAIALGYIIVEVMFKYARLFREKAGTDSY